jgi:hypothetical protein
MWFSDSLFIFSELVHKAEIGINNGPFLSGESKLYLISLQMSLVQIHVFHFNQVGDYDGCRSADPHMTMHKNIYSKIQKYKKNTLENEILFLEICNFNNEINEDCFFYDKIFLYL